MSRPETSTRAVATMVAPRTFLALAAGFLLLYAGICLAAWRQRGERAALESVVALPLPPEASPAAPAKPAPTPLEP